MRRGCSRWPRHASAGSPRSRARSSISRSGLDRIEKAAKARPSFESSHGNAAEPRLSERVSDRDGTDGAVIPTPSTVAYPASSRHCARRVVVPGGHSTGQQSTLPEGPARSFDLVAT